MQLSGKEKAMLSGERGWAARKAMEILTALGTIYGAERMIPVASVQIAGVSYDNLGEAGLQFLDQMATRGGRARVLTTLNPAGMDIENWQVLGISPEFAENQQRVIKAFVQMNVIPTCTCTPYLIGNLPRYGEHIAWAESSAVCYANSVIGARTNRYGDYLDISCALTGRAPAAGLHLEENRRGQLLLQLRGIPESLMERDDFYPVLGYLIGHIAGDRIPVVEGITATPTDDQLKALCAAAASSGAVALMHLVGITPEAPTAAHAFGGQSPTEVHTISMAELRAARAALTTTHDGKVDAVAFGSPHCSLAECRELARLMRGRRASPGVDVWITTHRAVRDILERSGELQVLLDFGATVTADTCIVVAPLLRPGIRSLMTNSAKYAHYAPGLLGVQSIFGSTEACVEAAITGRVPPDEGLWS